ncbi:MAG: 3-hydroxyacyl-CoA dehydrogenase family protein [Burkholderiaceae bacterium]
MKYQIIDTGNSRSFPQPHALTREASEAGELVFLIGQGAGQALNGLVDRSEKTAILIELGTECLGVHSGEDSGREGSNLLGFARFRLGQSEPTRLVELVKQPHTAPAAIAAATLVLEAAGLVVAVCNDFPGRIVDRLLRPYLNAVLRRLDEGLASAEDMDTTLRLGLGYPQGPIALLDQTGLAEHFDVSQALYQALGDAAYAPARRAQVAKQRQQNS